MGHMLLLQDSYRPLTGLKTYRVEGSKRTTQMANAGFMADTGTENEPLSSSILSDLIIKMVTEPSDLNGFEQKRMTTIWVLFLLYIFSDSFSLNS